MFYALTIVYFRDTDFSPFKSLGRTHINSCDFSVHSYSFDDTEDDFTLDDFDNDVTHDLDSGMVDMMLLATNTVKESYPNEVDEYGMRIIASPWSPPAWMKGPTSMDVKGAKHAANMTGSAEGAPVCLRDGVGSESKYASSWALYFSKFISACEFVECVALRCFAMIKIS
jgi:glucosylceramidase